MAGATERARSVTGDKEQAAGGDEVLNGRDLVDGELGLGVEHHEDVVVVEDRGGEIPRYAVELDQRVTVGNDVGGELAVLAGELVRNDLRRTVVRVVPQDGE